MSRLPLAKHIENLKSEANDIEKKLDRKLGTPEDIQRLEAINRQLETIEGMKKKTEGA